MIFDEICIVFEFYNNIFEFYNNIFEFYKFVGYPYMKKNKSHYIGKHNNL